MHAAALAVVGELLNGRALDAGGARHVDPDEPPRPVVSVGQHRAVLLGLRREPPARVERELDHRRRVMPVGESRRHHRPLRLGDLAPLRVERPGSFVAVVVDPGPISRRDNTYEFMILMEIAEYIYDFALNNDLTLGSFILSIFSLGGNTPL